MICVCCLFFFFQGEDGIRVLLRSRGRGDVYKRQVYIPQVLFKVLGERQAGMSKWLPAFVYGLPWPIFGWTPKTVSGYKKAEQIIRAKHGI